MSSFFVCIVELWEVIGVLFFFDKKIMDPVSVSQLKNRVAWFFVFSILFSFLGGGKWKGVCCERKTHNKQS